MKNVLIITIVLLFSWIIFISTVIENLKYRVGELEAASLMHSAALEIVADKLQNLEKENKKHLSKFEEKGIKDYERT